MRKSIFWIIIGVLGLSVFLPLIFQYYNPEDSYNFRGGCFMWPGHFWMGGMWIFPLIMLIAVLAVIYSIFNRGAVYPSQYESGEFYDTEEKSETALEILKKRYATGEITGEEFEQMKKALNS